MEERSERIAGDRVRRAAGVPDQVHDHAPGFFAGAVVTSSFSWNEVVEAVLQREAFTQGNAEVTAKQPVFISGEAGPKASFRTFAEVAAVEEGVLADRFDVPGVFCFANQLRNVVASSLEAPQKPTSW